MAGLIVAFIEDDLRRPPSWWKRVDGSIVNCVDDHCGSNPMKRLPYRDSDFEPFPHQQAPAWTGIAKDLLQASRVGNLLLRAPRPGRQRLPCP